MKIFQANIEKQETALLELEEQIKRFSALRVVSFLLSLIIISLLANEGQVALLFIAVPLCILVFATLLRRYKTLTHRKQTAEHLKTVNEKELLKLENKLSGFPTGLEHRKKDHAYISDLDVFGSHSLYQLLDRTTTESGSQHLAEWLSEPAAKTEILERQQAIRELQPKPDWRQQFEAAGLPFINAKSEYQKLLNWCSEPETLLPKKILYQIGSAISGVVATLLLGLTVIYADSIGWATYGFPLIIVLAINAYILRKLAPLADSIIDQTHRNVKTLGGYQMLAQTILAEEFETKKLKALQADLQLENSSATDEIGKLRKILEVFQMRGSKRSDNNKFYGLFNIFWLFDIYWIIKTEEWKLRNRAHIEQWTQSISEFEVLNSMAGFAYANPDYTFPDIKEAPYTINFAKLGHPLIKSQNRVCNDFDLQERGQIAMITGSNMAGKSTFLRTVGVNLVLALMGGPCCAQSGQVSHMKMFTSMRTEDNLEEGVSSFYAELQRVEQLLALITSGEPIFFMLDEMFKGTNSEDRYKGGVSLIKQLSDLNAFGLISTHDLELAKLAGNHMIVTNHSFNSKIQEGELRFNYTLEDGICTDFNASELMKKSGIKILNNVEKME